MEPRLCRQLVLVVRPIPVIQDRVQRGQVAAVRLQPGVEVLCLDRHDATVMPGPPTPQAEARRCLFTFSKNDVTTISPWDTLNYPFQKPSRLSQRAL